MSRTFDCSAPRERERGLAAAAAAVARGALVVVPTDTVYGVSTDAFQPDAVEALLALGYRESQVKAAVGELALKHPEDSAETLIRKALAKLTQSGYQAKTHFVKRLESLELAAVAAAAATSGSSGATRRCWPATSARATSAISPSRSATITPLWPVAMACAAATPNRVESTRS